MCGIYGALGESIDETLLGAVREATADRGRDAHGEARYALSRGATAVLGAHRAVPATEALHAPPQPYDGVVHNGIIANDRELGNPPGAVDSAILPAVLDRTSVRAFAGSLGRLQGSYALAVATPDTVLLAANYLPLAYVSPDGGRTVYFASMPRHLVAPTPRFCSPITLPAYSALDIRTGEAVALPRIDGKRAIVVASSGLDSTTVAAMLIADGYEVRLLHFTYGCRAETREVARIPRIAEALGISYAILPLDYTAIEGGTALFLGVDRITGGVAGAEYAHEWVPARNLIMLACATGYAEANGFHAVALGGNLEEGGAYPDNTESFLDAFDAVLPYATQNGYRVRLISPVARMMKAEIVAAGLAANAPYALTWSCYRDAETHCRKCGPCLMRSVAFARNGMADPAP